MRQVIVLCEIPSALATLLTFTTLEVGRKLSLLCGVASTVNRAALTDWVRSD